MPIVPPAAISPHDTWFGKSLGKLGLAPPMPVAREKIVEGKCGIIKTFVMGTNQLHGIILELQVIGYLVSDPVPTRFKPSPSIWRVQCIVPELSLRKGSSTSLQQGRPPDPQHKTTTVFFFVTDVNLCVFFFRVSIWGNLNSVQWMF